MIEIKVSLSPVYSGKNLALDQVLLNQYDYYTLNYFKDKNHEKNFINYRFII